MKYVVTMTPEGEFSGLCSEEWFFKNTDLFLDENDTYEVFEGPDHDGKAATFEQLKKLAHKYCNQQLLPEGLPTSYPMRKGDQSPERFAAALRRRAEIKLPTPVLLLQEPNGWFAMCRADTNMREVWGASIEKAMANLWFRWANPLPLRFPDDFPMMDREFDQLMKHGTLHQDDGQFRWYVLSMEARKRTLHELINESIADL